MLVKMLDDAINMLGPDVELLTEVMTQLGEQHSSYGVEPSFYPPMGSALIETLNELLGNDFSEEMRDAWFECYQEISLDMMRAKA